MWNTTKIFWTDRKTLFYCFISFALSRILQYYLRSFLLKLLSFLSTFQGTLFDDVLILKCSLSYLEYNIIWHDMIWYDVIWYDKIWYMSWYVMIWYVMIYVVICYDMIWYDIWYDMIWYDVVRYDMIWYDMMIYYIHTEKYSPKSCVLNFDTQMSSSQSEEWTMVFTREKNDTSNQNRERCFFTCEKNDTSNQKPQRCGWVSRQNSRLFLQLAERRFAHIRGEKFFSKSFFSLKKWKTFQKWSG